MADSVRRQLRDGVTEGEQVPVVCLLDSLDATSSPQIFKHFLSGLCENITTGRAQAKGIVAVAIEQPYEFLKDDSTCPKNDASSVDRRFQVIDCYSDPLGWEQSADDEAHTTVSPELTACGVVAGDVRDLDRLIVSILQRGTAALGHQTSERFAVLFDSVSGFDTSPTILIALLVQISGLLRFHSLPVVTKFLNALRSHERVSVLLFLVHADLHQPRVVSAFEYFATTVIFVTPFSEVSPDGVELDSVDGGSLRIRQKRRSGRVREQIERFHLSLSRVIFAPAEKVASSKKEKSSVPKVQFNLELTEKEREDRANVVLPFEHQGNGAESRIYDGRESAQLSSSLPAADKSNVPRAPADAGLEAAAEVKMLGEIHYLRDSDDERPDSDEDPDDDLDI